MLWLDTNNLFKFRHAALMVDKRQLEMDGAVEVIEKITPVFKNSVLVLILCKLIIDIIKSNGLRIRPILHTADTITPHFTVSNGFLR